VPVLIAVDGLGTTIWQREYLDGSGFLDTIGDLTSDPLSGDLFLLVHRGSFEETQRQELLRVRAADGQVRWSVEIDLGSVQPVPPMQVAYDPVSGRVVTVSSIGGSGANAADTLTVAYDGATGGLLWSDRFDAATIDRPTGLALASDGSLAFVLEGRGSTSSNLQGAVRALDLATGNLVWSIDDLGLGSQGRISTPEAAAGLAVVGTASGSTDRVVRALDPATGATLWDASLPSPSGGLLDHTPDGTQLFVAAFETLGPLERDVTTYALDGASGAVAWSQTYSTVVTGSNDVPRAVQASPDGTRVAIGVEVDALAPNLLATVVYDAASGAEVWRTATASIDEIGVAEPSTILFSADGNRVLVAGTGPGATGSDDAVSIAYAADDGGLDHFAQVDLSDSGDEQAPNIAVDPVGERVIVASTVRGNVQEPGQALVTARDPVTGAILWSRSLGAVPAGSESAAIALGGSGARVHLLFSDSEGVRLLTLRGLDGLTLWERTFPDRNSPGGLDLGPGQSRLYLALSRPAGGPFSPTDLEVLAVDAISGLDLWQASFDGGLIDAAKAIAVSPDGSKVAVLAAQQTDNTPPLSSQVIDSQFLTRVHDSQSGALRWSDLFDAYPGSGTNVDDPRDLAFSPDGARLFAVGASDQFGNGFTQSVALGYDVASGARLWSSVKYDGPEEGTSTFDRVRTTADGSLVAIGGSKLDNAQGRDLLGLGLDPLDGSIVWETRIDDGANEFFTDAAFDATGSLLLLAGCRTEWFFLTTALPVDAQVAALDTETGALLWRSRDLAPAGKEVAVRVAWDGAGKRLIAGTQVLGPESFDLRLDAVDEPLLVGLEGALSVASGGTQALGIRPGAAFAGNLYLLLGSASGTSPGIPVGDFELPLVADAYTDLTLRAQAPLSNSFAAIDADGAALASFELPAASSPALAGLTLHHAYVVIDASFGFPLVTAVSNPLPLELVP
jgi:WD40 repeat protein